LAGRNGQSTIDHRPSLLVDHRRNIHKRECFYYAWYHLSVVERSSEKGGAMAFKFEDLDVWKLSLEHLDGVYRLADRLPKEEVYNLRSQWIRVATSISFNIAEGSTGQSNLEQGRFLGYAVRSLAESAPCLRIAQHRGFLPADPGLEEQMDKLVRKLQSFRAAIVTHSNSTRTVRC
jgi:four helix bundle protein